VQHEHNVLKIALEPTGNLAQCDAVQIKDVDFDLAKPSYHSSPLASLGGERDELGQRHFFEVQPQLSGNLGQRCSEGLRRSTWSRLDCVVDIKRLSWVAKQAECAAAEQVEFAPARIPLA